MVAQETHKPTQEKHKRKIFIYGSQQCTGLASHLINLRKNTKYEDYSITAEIKSYASTEEILRTLPEQTVDTNDKLILCIDEISWVLTTYYICCLKYITDVDLSDIVRTGKEEHILFMLDDQSCIPTILQDKYETLKDSKVPIPQGTLAFHAVYGAYVLGRPVANKAEFRQWIVKRYNAFMSSIQQTAETTVQLDIQSGGTRVNNLSVSRPTLRKAVYQIIRSEYNNIRVSAVKTHIKMLTDLSEMTTYTLVNKVLATGGNVILIKPLPSQVVKFLNEKVNIEKLLEESGYEREDIIYIHLFMPHIPLICDKSDISQKMAKMSYWYKVNRFLPSF
ncbi:hypothetical protein ACJJTC_002354 [Scirpophaga incertulas]